MVWVIQVQHMSKIVCTEDHPDSRWFRLFVTSKARWSLTQPVSCQSFTEPSVKTRLFTWFLSNNKAEIPCEGRWCRTFCLESKCVNGSENLSNHKWKVRVKATVLMSVSSDLKKIQQLCNINMANRIKMVTDSDEEVKGSLKCHLWQPQGLFLTVVLLNVEKTSVFSLIASVQT